MGPCFRLAAALLLLLQALPPTLPQDSTDSPGRTIDKSWYRSPPNNTAASQQGDTPEGGQETTGEQEDTPEGGQETTGEQEDTPEGGQESTAGAPESDSEGMSSTAYGWLTGPMSSGEEEEENPESEGTDRDNNTLHNNTLHNNTLHNNTLHSNTLEANESSTPAAPRTETTPPAGSDPALNGSGSEDTPPTLPSNFTSGTAPSATAAPASTASDSTPVPWPPGAPGGTTAGAGPREPGPPGTPEGPLTAAPSATAAPTLNATGPPSPETTLNATVPVTVTTTLVPGTTEKSNATDRDAALEESNTDRGLISSSRGNKKNEAWAAILGTAVVVCVLASVAFVILKKKNQKAFSHRKLVEFSSDPVLTLDNSESLESTSYGRGAYFNPALQMTAMPRHNGSTPDGYMD